MPGLFGTVTNRRRKKAGGIIDQCIQPPKLPGCLIDQRRDPASIQ